MLRNLFATDVALEEGKLGQDQSRSSFRGLEPSLRFFPRSIFKGKQSTRAEEVFEERNLVRDRDGVEPGIRVPLTPSGYG